MQDNFEIVKPDLNVDAIKRHFDSIPADIHFEEGDYRYRTASILEYNDGDLKLLENIPLYQSLNYNTLEGYGGKSRKYADIPREMVDCPDFRKLIDSWISTLPIKVDRFSAHQIRTKAPGAPVPEGRHRDGYDWIGMYVARRQNINSETGVTTVWANDGEQVLSKGVLQEGTLISFDDREVIHYTSPVDPANENEAIRDVIILTIPDHSFVLE